MRAVTFVALAAAIPFTFAAAQNGGAGNSRIVGVVAGGHFFTRDDIDKRKPNNITDVIKGLPSVTVTYQRGGTVVRGRGGITSKYSAPPPCTRVFIDGFEWRDLQPGDLDMFVNPDDVIGLEVYQAGEMPSQFRTLDRGCLTLVVWTQCRGKARK